MSMKIKTYSELSKLHTFHERYEYLKLSGDVGASTFGFDRIFNQRFYNSREWKAIRREVIIRDTGMNDYCCDLGMDGHEIHGIILIHHMNPIDINDIRDATDFLLNPEYLIATVHNTHNAIHYGDESLIVEPIERTKNDTCPWRRVKED